MGGRYLIPKIIELYYLKWHIGVLTF